MSSSLSLTKLRHTLYLRFTLNDWCLTILGLISLTDERIDMNSLRDIFANLRLTHDFHDEFFRV